MLPRGYACPSFCVGRRLPSQERSWAAARIARMEVATCLSGNDPVEYLIPLLKLFCVVRLVRWNNEFIRQVPPSNPSQNGKHPKTAGTTQARVYHLSLSGNSPTKSPLSRLEQGTLIAILRL